MSDDHGYAERRRQAQHDAIAEMSGEIGDEDDPEEIRSILKRARREVAAFRRGTLGGST